MTAFQKKAIWIAGLVTLFLGGSLYLHHQDQLNAVQAPPKPVVMQSETTKEKQTCTVYISGAVHQPGLYQVDPKSRVQEVLPLAGGVTPEADLNRINLAKVVKDGMQINVPEQKNKSSTSKTALKEAKSNQSATEKIKGPLSLNRATAQELDRLPGIGSTLAQRIVEYRNEKGQFQNLEQLKEVQGMSNSKIEKLRSYLVVE